MRAFESRGLGVVVAPGEGCHQILPERGLIRPGELVVGGDSRSTTYGALNAAASGGRPTWRRISGALWFRSRRHYRSVSTTVPASGRRTGW